MFCHFKATKGCAQKERQMMNYKERENDELQTTNFPKTLPYSQAKKDPLNLFH